MFMFYFDTIHVIEITIVFLDPVNLAVYPARDIISERKNFSL